MPDQSSIDDYIDAARQVAHDLQQQGKALEEAHAQQEAERCAQELRHQLTTYVAQGLQQALGISPEAVRAIPHMTLFGGVAGAAVNFDYQGESLWLVRHANQSTVLITPAYETGTRRLQSGSYAELTRRAKGNATLADKYVGKAHSIVLYSDSPQDSSLAPGSFSAQLLKILDEMREQEAKVKASDQIIADDEAASAEVEARRQAQIAEQQRERVAAEIAEKKRLYEEALAERSRLEQQGVALGRVVTLQYEGLRDSAWSWPNGETLTLYRWQYQSGRDEEGQAVYHTGYGFSDHLDANGYVTLYGMRYQRDEGSHLRLDLQAHLPVIERLELHSVAELPPELRYVPVLHILNVVERRETWDWRIRDEVPEWKGLVFVETPNEWRHAQMQLPEQPIPAVALTLDVQQVVLPRRIDWNCPGGPEVTLGADDDEEIPF